jgi:hypothetical protein
MGGDSSPNPTTVAYENDYLTGVAATSKTNAWAVGYYVNTAGAQFSYSEHWNGKNWTIVSMPNPGNVNGNGGTLPRDIARVPGDGDVLGGWRVCERVPIRAARRTVERHVLDSCGHSKHFGKCLPQRRRRNLARKRLGGWLWTRT